MNRVPRLGEPVTLHDVRGLFYASRIEGVDESHLTVAEPLDLRAAESYDRGMELEVVWTEENGIHTVPTRLDATSVDNHVRLWHLTVTGAGWSEQRRDYVRVPLSGRLVITPPPDTGSPFDAAFLDLSEVAAQCLVELPRGDPRIAEGCVLSCSFTIVDDEFVIDGTVIIVRPGTSARESRIVVRFAPSRAQSDALRRNVFRLQLAHRRGLQA